jgi:hypothetical protein
MVWTNPTEASRGAVCSGIIRRPNNVNIGKGKPNLTWEESLKTDMKGWDIVKELAIDRKVWKLYTCQSLDFFCFYLLFFVLVFCSFPLFFFSIVSFRLRLLLLVFMCSILWVSSLAYPNLFGTKKFCCCCCAMLCS